MTKCITFYSYKGGSGRSTTAVNTIPHLIQTLNASAKRPILVVDADLESAGLTYFFGLEHAFTYLFDNSLHTTKLFNEATSALDDTEADRLFSNRQKTFDLIKEPSLMHALDHPSLQKAFSVEVPMTKLFEGIKLRRFEMDTLQEMADACAEPRSEEKKAIIKKRYELDIIRVIGQMDKIHKDNTLSEEEKIMQKQEVLQELFPAMGFVDISNYFACSKGTVKFLGADVRYQGDQVVRSETTTKAIRRLIRLCNEREYAAIIFDSGAGTQSSAEAFHRVSDTLVYCMRPTKQFRRGTFNHLQNQYEVLQSLKKKKGADYKPVILLPTAVPTLPTDENTGIDAQKLCNEAFKDILTRASIHESLVDTRFCTPETALGEVALFKWEERILLNEDQVKGNADQIKALDVYKKLAWVITEMAEK